MRYSSKYAAVGCRPAIASRRWIVLAAGLLALCLQLAAQIMPAEAMQGAMRAAALTAEEAQSFAATCLGFGGPQKGQPGGPSQHASCPVCFTLAQAQGLAAPTIDLAWIVAWPDTRPAPPALPRLLAGTGPTAFDSQAPPALAVL